jgi:hypothetical protein
MQENKRRTRRKCSREKELTQEKRRKREREGYEVAIEMYLIGMTSYLGLASRHCVGLPLEVTSTRACRLLLPRAPRGMSSRVL